MQKHPTTLIDKHDLSSLKVLGSVGEPINAEAWHWYDAHVGKHNCPIVDTWWQTETGGILITSLAGVTPQKPTFATLPMPGIQAVLLNNEGDEIEGEGEGILAIKHPWPSIARTIWGDHERYKNVYFSAYPVLKDEIKAGSIPWGKDNVITLYDQLCEQANTTFPDFMREAFHCPRPRSEVIAAGREVVADTGLFITKKRYAVRVYDLEGNRTDKDGKLGKVKAMGLDLKRSDTPVFMQDYLKT